MKTWKLVSGIISIVMFVVVVFQSCAAGIVNTLDENGGDHSGSVGFMLALLMLIGGIISVATRQSTGKGGNIAIAIVFALAALFGFTGYGIFSDLIIWSGWCAINAVLAIYTIAVNDKAAKASKQKVVDGADSATTEETNSNEN